MQRNSSFQNTETSKVSNLNIQEEEDGLHILRVLQDLEDGMLMESRDSISYVLSLQKIVKIMVVLILIITTQWMQSSETTKTTTTLVAYDELEKAFAEV